MYVLRSQGRGGAVLGSSFGTTANHKKLGNNSNNSSGNNNNSKATTTATTTTTTMTFSPVWSPPKQRARRPLHLQQLQQRHSPGKAAELVDFRALEDSIIVQRVARGPDGHAHVVTQSGFRFNEGAQ